MSRQSGIVALLVVLAGAFPLLFGPFDVGAVRLAGVSLTWWYVAVVAPVAAAAVTVLARVGEGAAGGHRRIVAWTSPVLFGVIGARVFAGDPGAPLLVLAALVAPLVALLVDGWSARGTLARVGSVVGIGLVVSATVALLTGLARELGVDRWRAVVIAVAIVALPPLGVRVARRRAMLVAVALGALLAALTALGATLRASPWTAWAEVARRPALVFGERSAWVVEGKRVGATTTLSFSESHRVTAAAPGVYRVLERDGVQARDSSASHAELGAASRAAARPAGRSEVRPVAREWRLATGDSLGIRPGDQLTLQAGAHARFESGKRVPGAPVSGVSWAEPPGRRSAASALEALGMTVTLLGGALALVGVPGPSTRRDTAAATGVAVAFALVAAVWGIYAVRGAPDLALGASTPQFLLATPAVLVPAPWHGVLIAMTAGALALLASAAAVGLRERLDDALGGDGSLRSVVWLALAAVASVVALWPADAWRLLLLGLGFAGSVGVAPLLARGERRSQLAGALLGATAFSLLALVVSRLPGWAAPLGATPALVAAPLAWGTAAIVARVAAPRRG